MAGRRKSGGEFDINKYILFLNNRIKKRKHGKRRGAIDLWRVKWRKMIWIIKERRPAIESRLIPQVICETKPSFEQNPADYTMEDLQSINNDMIDINASLHHVIKHTDDTSVYEYDETDDDDNDISISPYITPADYNLVK